MLLNITLKTESPISSRGFIDNYDKYVYESLKKYWLLNLELTEFPTGQIFDKFFAEDQLISEYLRTNFNYIYIGVSNDLLL